MGQWRLSGSTFTAWLLGLVASTSMGAIYFGQDYFQAMHAATIVRGVTPSLQVGQDAPPHLIPLASLPSTLIFFPPCSECSVESPSDLADMKFNKVVAVVLVDSGRGWTDREAHLSKLKVTRVGSEAIRWFGLRAAPRVVQIARGGKIAFIQPSYVPIGQLEKYINDL